MKMNNFLTVPAILIFAFGCAHSTMRGTVAMKSSENEAHVCMGKGEVTVGDKVNVFKSVCETAGIGGARDNWPSDVNCKKTLVGTGTVTEVLNDHYSVVKFDAGVRFDEGTFVEKL